MRPAHVLAVIAINAMFGSAFALGKIGVDHFPPFFFTAMRSVLIVLCLLPFLRLAPIERRHWKPLLMFTLTMGILVFVTMYSALQLTSSVSPIVIGTQLSTPVAIILSWIFLKEKVGPITGVAVMAAFGGVVLIAFDESLLDSVPALMWCGCMALAYGTSTVISRSLRELDARVISAWMALMATGPVLILSLVFEEGQWQSVLSAGWVDWAMVLHAGIGVSVLGHVSMFALLSRYPIGQVMPYYVLTPVFGVLFSVILFDEQLTAQILTGAAIVILAIMTINRRAARDRRRAEALASAEQTP